MESEKISEKQEEIISILEEKFPTLPSREDIINVLQDTQFGAQGEWLCPKHCYPTAEEDLFVLGSIAWRHKVNMSILLLASLLFVLLENYQEHIVSSPATRKTSLQPVLWGCHVRVCDEFTEVSSHRIPLLGGFYFESVVGTMLSTMGFHKSSSFRKKWVKRVMQVKLFSKLMLFKECVFPGSVVLL